MPIDIAKIKSKYPNLEIDELVEKFEKIDVKKSGSLIQNDSLKLCQSLPEKYGFDQITKTVKKHVTGGMEFDEFVEVVADLKQQGVQKGPGGVEAEDRANLVDYINNQLKDDKDLASKLPFQLDSAQIFDELKDGIVLGKLVNKVVPNTVDEKKFTKNPTNFQRTENQNIALNAAKQIGCTVQLNPVDLESGNTKQLTSLLHSILKVDLQSKVNVSKCPEIMRLAKDKEEVSHLAKLKTEDILIRWINYHAERSNISRICTNLDKDLKDGEFLTLLLHRLNKQCTLQPMKELNIDQRLSMIVDNAAICGVNQFISPSSISEANLKMNVAFLATLFYTKHGLLPMDQNEFQSTNPLLFQETDRALQGFALFIDSFTVEPINNLLEQVQDGQILALAINKIVPNSVDYKRINKNTTSRIKKLENCNYIVEVGKKIGIVTNMGGNDLGDGNKSLLLAFLTKLHQLSMEVELKKAGDGKPVADADLISWANKTAKAGGSKESLVTFKDSMLGTSRFYLELMSGMSKRLVNFGLVQEGFGDEQKRDNAKYAISCAYELGAVLFCAPEDLMEVKPKLVY
eukprot:NODE_530_length_7152_cov_0.525876.p1 type:complete len:573 gc:universal NODE_530_length_7152_cov_0.525876:4141-2423(-)